jgi:hypothetical protein
MAAMQSRLLSVNGLAAILPLKGGFPTIEPRRFAMTAQTTNATPIRSAFAPVVALGRGLYGLFATTAAALRCAREAERLFGLSDAELAKLGLRRDEIVQHAFATYVAR